jgi:hypothetical protein
MTPARDPQDPSRTPSPACDHPYGSLRLQGVFRPDDVDASVWAASCFECGSEWSDQDDHGAPWERLMEIIASGNLAVMSQEDVEVRSRIERQQEAQYAAIMQDVRGAYRRADGNAG